ncbi:hypothetical protein NYG90_05075 [Helicobacter sp. XJK30-2]|uniref:Uncharacterized protein n=1 Tax=Helicobacter zhangjianzhongii TaxID=2974574 RepID=A0ACC6FS65_9HELI|nr:hypothetical protein [Helicobacter sp. XJK30-2]MDL0082049.1 hypothetical protein [Helicobacter sp. XJK30-2]
MRQQGVAIHKGAQADSKKNAQKATPLESTFEKTQMDCHADFQSARNDRNNATTQKVDSRTDCRTIAIAWACNDNKEFDKQKQILL